MTGGSHCSPQAAFTLPSPHSSPLSIWQVDEQPSQSSLLPSSHISPAHLAPSPHPVSIRHCALQPSQSRALPSSHSSLGSSRPLPHAAVCGGSSIFTNLPRPGSPGPGGSLDVHVQTLLSGSNS